YRVPDRSNDVGYQAVMVPGFVRGCWAAFQQFGSGRVSWADVLAPSVRLASKGFEVPPYGGTFWNHFVQIENGSRARLGGKPRWDVSPGSRALMLNDQGQAYDIGDWFVQPDLASTLQRLADAGADDFYDGEIGAQIAADLEGN